jgi:hypothetical protein
MVSNELTIQLLLCRGRAVARDETARRGVVGQIRDAILSAGQGDSGRREGVEK